MRQSLLKNTAIEGIAGQVHQKKWWHHAYNQRYLYLMSIPFVIWIIIFQYVPIWGWLFAFQDYKLGRGVFEQEWVGLKHFVNVFTDARFWNAFRNTMAMSIMQIIARFTLPIILALFINEMYNGFYKRFVQTVSYLPHFVSWVVVAGIVIQMLSVENGVVNQILVGLGLIEEPIHFMTKPKLFWYISTGATAWKETGWASIIYLAAISGIDQDLYDAATVDGCGRFRKMWYVTLPGIMTTIVVLFIMAIGHLNQVGFQKQLLLGNPIVMDYAEVIQIYVLKYGIALGRYSFGTAVGVFNSVVSVILLVTANTIVKRTRDEGLF
jgi:putative aldouronate transport system permease protein